MSCIRCTYCCKFMHIYLPNDFQIKEWAKARGFKINQYSNDRSMIEFSLYHPCPHLKGRDCDIEKNKPVACKLYPGKGMEEFDFNTSLGKECGYRE